MDNLIASPPKIFPDSPKSWKSLFTSSNFQALKFFQPDLRDGKQVVQPPRNVVEDGESLWSLTLVGQFYGSAPNITIIGRTVNKLWGRDENIEVKKLNAGMFLFVFQKDKTRDWILESGPWHIQHKALCLRKWKPGVQPLQIDQSEAPVIKKVTQLCDAFLWKGDEHTARGARVSWEAVCTPKEEGGLGVKDAKVWNTACMMRNLWQILIRAQSLWVAWVESYILKGESIWSINSLPRHSWSWKKILKIRDKIAILPGPISEYTAKEIWNMLRSQADPVPWYNLIWKGKIIPRYNIIAWQAILNRLPTKDRTSRWGRVTDPTCCLCCMENEDQNHLFNTCQYTNSIWEMIHSACNLSYSSNDWDDFVQYTIDRTKGSTPLVLIYKLAWTTTIYMIWQERNGRQHGKSHRDVASLFTTIRNTIHDRIGRKRGNMVIPQYLVVTNWQLN